jgi:nucleoside-diphosphate-sugar epimerase
MTEGIQPAALTTGVIGGAGFIGRAVVAELLAQGCRVLGCEAEPMPPLRRGALRAQPRR